MHVLFLDTETTGLTAKGYLPSEYEKQPRLVQLAFVVMNDERKEVEFDLTIKPNGYTIPTDASDIHGITTDVAMTKGIPISDAITILHSHLPGIDRLVCHNVTFDDTVIQAELIRGGYWECFKLWLQPERFCTMREMATDRRRFRSLNECHLQVAGVPIENAHNAMGDVIAMMTVYDSLN